MTVSHTLGACALFLQFDYLADDVAGEPRSQKPAVHKRPSFRFRFQGNERLTAGCILRAESDPDFRKKAAQQLDKRKKVIVYCSRGGTLKTGFGNDRKFFKDDPERMFGIESRSLKACYELLEVRVCLLSTLAGLNRK